jgi:hypothetical protein
MKERKTILWGDLNITLKIIEIWGSSVREDPLFEFLVQKFEEANLVDVEPIKTSPTCRNLRARKYMFSKRVDRFLVSNSVINYLYRIR